MKIKIVASVFAGIALLGSIVAVNTWLELRKQRAVNAALPERQIEVPLPASPPAAPPPDITVAAATPPETPISRTEPAVSAPTQSDRNDLLEKLLPGTDRQKERLKDPKFRKALHEQVLLTLKQSHPDLAQELGLLRDEAERLFDLLADDHFARLDEGSNRGGPEVDAAEARLTQQELDRQLEESIRAQLGDKYPQWQAYQQTRPTRVQVASLSKQLTSAGQPLSAEQYKTLTTVWIAERQRQAEDEELMPPNPVGNPADPAQKLAELLKRKEVYIRRMLEVTAPYVDAAQLAAMQKEMGQESMYELALRLAAQRQQAHAQ